MVMGHDASVKTEGEREKGGVSNRNGVCRVRRRTIVDKYDARGTLAMAQ